MHDWTALLLADPTNPSGAIPGGVIGLLIITVPTTITAVAALVWALRRRTDDAAVPPPLPVPPPSTPDGDALRDKKRVAVLTRFLERNNVDATKIKNGTEAIDSVRIHAP